MYCGCHKLFHWKKAYLSVLFRFHPVFMLSSASLLKLFPLLFKNLSAYCGISSYVNDFCATLKYLKATVLCKLTFAVNWHILTVSINFQTKVDKIQNRCNSVTTRQTSWMKGWSVSESHLLLWNVKNPAVIYIDDENSIKHI